MASAEALLLGARLDEDHAPVTNGWMAVCRRCGAYTDGPQGHHHLPSDLRLDRAHGWLDAKSLARPHQDARIKASVGSTV
jgi:hypothetical protein